MTVEEEKEVNEIIQELECLSDNKKHTDAYLQFLNKQIAKRKERLRDLVEEKILAGF